MSSIILAISLISDSGATKNSYAWGVVQKDDADLLEVDVVRWAQGGLNAINELDEPSLETQLSFLSHASRAESTRPRGPNVRLRHFHLKLLALSSLL